MRCEQKLSSFLVVLVLVLSGFVGCAPADQTTAGEQMGREDAAERAPADTGDEMMDEGAEPMGGGAAYDSIGYVGGSDDVDGGDSDSGGSASSATDGQQSPEVGTD